MWQRAGIISGRGVPSLHPPSCPPPPSHMWLLLQSEYSKRLASVRKDVECTFGILKGRFRILKTPCLFHDKANVDNMFRTCCMLHNILLEDDCIHAGMVGAALHAAVTYQKELWLGDLGLHSRAHDSGRVSFGLRRAKMRPDWDVSGVEWVRAVAWRKEVDEGWRHLHDALVTHYSILTRKGQAVWIA